MTFISENKLEDETLPESKSSKINIKAIKKIIHYTWMILVILGIVWAFLHPQIFTAEGISAFLHQSGDWVWYIYATVTLFRGVFLFPSTPFVLAGMVLFPNDLFAVAVVSMIGILSSATMLYYFAEYLGFGDYLSSKYPEKIEKARIQLNKPSGKWIILALAWFPFIPTDVICYAAGLVRMRYSIMIVGIFLGEGALIAMLLCCGKEVFV